MSFVYKAVQDLVDEVLDHVKEGLDDYARSAKQDIEVFVDQLVRQVIKAMAIGTMGAVVLSAGLIFALIGLVKYLSELTNPAIAWGVVGLGMMGMGAILLLTIMRRASRGLKHDHRLAGGN